MDIKKSILNLKPLNFKDYENLDLDRMVVYTLAFLENRKIPLYFDYITVALFKLFPKKFSMANFDQYPDAYRANNAIRRLAGGLRHANKADWVTGSVEHGFYLTEAGEETAKQVEGTLKSPFKQKVSVTKKRSRGKSPMDDVEEVKNSTVFKKWYQKNLSITEYDILSLLRAVPYTPKTLLLQYVEGLRESAKTVREKSIIDFLDWVEKKFYNLFH